MDGAESGVRVRQTLARGSGEGKKKKKKRGSGGGDDPLTSALASSRELISGLQGSSYRGDSGCRGAHISEWRCGLRE